MYTAKDMRHEDFQIGIEFWCSSRRWRCTDIGTRVVVGVCLEPHEVVTVARDAQTSIRTVTRTITADESWLAGPPLQYLKRCSTNTSIRAVEMTRKIRDRHARRLAGKTPEEIIAFYRAAGIVRVVFREGSKRLDLAAVSRMSPRLR